MESKTFYIFDLHLDLEIYLDDPASVNMKFRNFDVFYNNRHGDIPQFLQGGLKIAVVNVFPFKRLTSSWPPVSKAEFENKIAKLKSWLFSYEVFKEVRDRKHLQIVSQTPGTIGVILGVEGLDFLQKTSDVDWLYKLGIRCFGLNWLPDSKFATSSNSNSKKGLKKAGRELIRAIRNLNAVLDLAHSSESTIEDTLEIYDKRIILSHNGLKKFVRHNRNVSFKILKLLEANRGLLGLTLIPRVVCGPKKEPSIRGFLKQFTYLEDYFLSIGAFGSDFFGFQYANNYDGARNFAEFSKVARQANLNQQVLYQNAFSLFLESL